MPAKRVRIPGGEKITGPDIWASSVRVLDAAIVKSMESL
jgi:hypothetical protein